MRLTILTDKKFVIEDEPHLMLVEMKGMFTHLTCFLKNRFVASDLTRAGEIVIRHAFFHGLHKYVIILHTYMPLYTMIYTIYFILPSSENPRKGPADAMNSNGQGKPLAMQSTSNHAIRSLFPEPMTKRRL